MFIAAIYNSQHMGAILVDKGDKGDVTIYMSHMYWNTNSPCHHFTHEKLSTWLLEKCKLKQKKKSPHTCHNGFYQKDKK